MDSKIAASLQFQLDYLLNTTSRFAKVSSALAALLSIYAVKRYITPSPLAAVPGPPSSSYLTGHFTNIAFAKDGTEFCEQITEEYGGAVKLKSLLGTEILYVSDPLAIHHILRDTNLWPKASYISAINQLLFGPGLLSSYGDVHHRQRKMLNPIFTTPYIRHLTPVFYAVAHQLRDTMQMRTGTLTQLVDMTELLAQVALELIGQAGMGHHFGSLQGGSNEFVKASKDMIPALAGVAPAIPFLPFLIRLGSSTFRRKVSELIPWPALRRVLRDVDDIHNTSVNIYQNKKNVLQSGAPNHTDDVYGDSKDIITQLLKANSEASQEDQLTEVELVAQVTTLLFGATDTTSTALAKTLHLLATHQDIQDRLRTEIMEARKANNNRDLDYQGVEELQLLSAVVRETLRLCAPIPHLPRVSSKDDVIPLRYPIKSTDGNTQLNSIPVPKGTEVYIGMVSANTSKNIWGPDASEWKPERWMSPLLQSLIDAKVPGVFPNIMTFWSGTKSCIGYRFALQEMKVVLCVLLESFKFEPGPDVEWHMGLLMTPYVVGNVSEPQLPLKVRYIGE